MSPIYEEALHRIRVCGRDHGYSIGLFGSGTDDLDLVAIPFDNKVAPATDLVVAITKAIRGTINNKKYPKQMLYNRQAWIIEIDPQHWIDFSIVNGVKDA